MAHPSKKPEEPLYGFTSDEDGGDLDDELEGAPPFVVRPFTSESAAASMFNYHPDEGSMSSGGLDSDPVVHTRAATTSSIASAMTEMSVPPVFAGHGMGSSSSSHMGSAIGSSGHTSSLPFPFPNRPGLPHVDDFVPKSKLAYDHMRMMSGYEKKAAFAKKGVNFPGDVHQPPHFLPIKTGMVVAPGSAPGGLGSPSYGNLSTLTERQVYLFIEYIQFFGEVDAQSSAYRGITYADIETALRQHTRTTLALEEGTDDPTALLMAAFDDLLKRSKLTPTSWFQRNSMQKAGNEPKLTKELFCQSIRGMCREHLLPAWTNHDMRQLRLHLSVDGQTEPTMSGVLRAFRRYHALGEEKTVMDAAHPVVAKIKKLMRKRKIRILDFFNCLQADPLKPMSARTLAHAIDQVLAGGSAVPVYSPRRRTSQASLLGQEPSAISMLSAPATAGLPHRSNTLSLSKIHAAKSSILLSSITGKIPGRKPGGDAIKIDPLPTAIDDFLDEQFVLGQRSLYSNGSVYANSEGRKKIANVITSLRTRRSLQLAEAAAVPTLYVAPVYSLLILHLRQSPFSSLPFPLGTARTRTSTMSQLDPISRAGPASPATSGGSPKNSATSPPKSPQVSAVAPATAPTLASVVPRPPTWAAMSFSKKFAEMTKKKTTLLMEHFNTYDKKRERHERELVAQF